MDESQQYEKVCKGEFACVREKLDDIRNKLYVDNGGESFQSRLNRHDRWMKVIMGIVAALALAILSFCLFMAQEKYRESQAASTAITQPWAAQARQ